MLKILPTSHPPNNKSPAFPRTRVTFPSFETVQAGVSLLSPQSPWATCAADYSSLNLPWPFAFVPEVFNYLGLTRLHFR